MLNVKVIKKNIKNSYIRVDDDLTVRVNCPKNTPDTYIESLLERKKSWIDDRIKVLIKKREIKQANIDNILFLGKYYDQIDVLSEDSFLLFKDNRFIFNLTRIPYENMKTKLLKEWKKGQLERIVEKHISRYSELTGLYADVIEYKSMTSRWGYCQKNKKRIVFSNNLINMHESFVEYVVLHELCHLKVPTHGKRFYSLLEKYMPEYKEKKKTVNSLIET